VKKLFGILVASVMLAGCSVEGIVETAYPDRERFAFQSQDGESVLKYVCERKGSDRATKANARRAHQFLDGRMERLVDSLIDRGALPSDRALENTIEKYVEETEERYQCLFYDIIDT